MARIGTTLTELARDRDALLATLRAAAPYAAAPYAMAATVAPAAVAPGPEVPAAAPVPPPAPAPVPLPPPPPAAPPPAAARPPGRPHRRLSPQQVLLGLGAVLLVAAAIAFVAVAWTRLGVVFQAAVMVVVTAAACATSAWAARRGLRATEEALAAAGAALMAVDLGGARVLGLLRLEDVILRLYLASSCAIVLVLTVVLARLTRSTATWPLAALLAAQPLPFLLLPFDVFTGPAGVAEALALAAADLVVAGRLRRGLRPVARVLAGVAGVGGVFGGLATASGSDPTESWTATGLLLLAGAAAVASTRGTGARSRFAVPVTTAAAAVGGLALADSLRTLGDPGPVVATATGLALLTAAVLAAGHRTATTASVAGGTVLALAGAAQLAGDGRPHPLALLVLAATVPAALVVVASPTALRLVLVVVAAAAVVVLGTLTHRQAPFVLGAVVLAVVVVGRLAPYAPLLPRWLTLGAAGLLLLVLGATYERRRQQAREAVAWIGQMH